MKKNICEICKKEFKGNSGLGRHVKISHNILSKDYYDLYFKKSNEDECNICNKKTNFRNWSVGYLDYCSPKCANLDPEVNKKKKETNFKKTGFTHNFSNPENREKAKKTCLKKYGKEFSFQSKNNKEKSKKIILKKYGVDNVSKNKEIKKRIKERMLLAKKNFFIKNILPKGYTLIDYNLKENIKLKCPKEHIFECQKQLILKRKKAKHNCCVVCNPLNSYSSHKSSYENELAKFIKENYSGNVIKNTQKILQTKELDVYIPKRKLAFEFNGLYWHNELKKNKEYHLDKTNECENLDIHLIHIYEDDWLYKNDIVKSRILNLLGKSERIFARKCIIKNVKKKDSNLFLENNHIQDKCNSKYNYGLYYKDKLVSLITFGKSRFEKNKMELIRFCNLQNKTIIGGASKLFNHFLKENENVKEVVSYADRSWSLGNLYKQLKFKEISKTIPNYYYIINGIRENRFAFRKSELIKQGFSKDKTEKEIMFDRGLYRIYDSGNLKYVYKR